MQISDLTRQYNSTTAPEAMQENRGVEKLVSTVRDLTAGHIFEGTVNVINGGRVTLGLSNGTELAARLEANMQLVKGQSMFFQVKSNDGETIAIRPYTVDGSGVNLTLMNALKAANLPINAKNLNMVNAMMQEQMPINQNGLAQMARVLMANPDMSVNTLVQMKKLDIPITPEMVSQFENYMDDSSAIHKAMDSFISELPVTLNGKGMSLEQMKSFQSEFLSILAEGVEEGVNQGANGEVAGATGELCGANGAGNEVSGNTGVTNGVQGESTQIPLAEMTAQVLEEGVETQKASVETSNINGQETALEGAEQNQLSVKTESVATQDKVFELLNKLFGDTGIAKGDSTATILNKLSQFISNGNVTPEALQELFSNKDMQHFLKDVLEQQMYLKPEEVADKEKVKKLFEGLESKTQKLENLLLNANLKHTPLAQTIADVRGNVEFMNQLNQAYTYVQIPLKMSGQNASGQLYVYTNKRELGDAERDLTAFLHLDMDFLGSTDVSVRMHKKDVDTKFYMDSDESYALVKAHMPELEERLRRKGFNCNIYVESGGKKVDFVEDFLKKDAPATGQLHRYSFDVRA